MTPIPMPSLPIPTPTVWVAGVTAHVMPAVVGFATLVISVALVFMIMRKLQGH
jgi:hypothetical protein